MMLSGLSATAATRTALPRRAALRARAGQAVQMKSMGASKRSARLAVASAVPTPGAAPVRYASARTSSRVPRARAFRPNPRVPRVARRRPARDGYGTDVRGFTNRKKKPFRKRAFVFFFHPFALRRARARRRCSCPEEAPSPCSRRPAAPRCRSRRRAARAPVATQGSSATFNSATEPRAASG